MVPRNVFFDHFDFGHQIYQIFHPPFIFLYPILQGNLLKGIGKKTVRKGGIEPIKSVCFYVLFSVTHLI